MQEIEEVQLGNLFARVITDYMEDEGIHPGLYKEIVKNLSNNLLEAYVGFKERMDGGEINRRGDTLEDLY